MINEFLSAVYQKLLKNVSEEIHSWDMLGVNSSESRNAENEGENKKCRKLNDKKNIRIF